MAFGSDDISLLFKMRGDSADAQQASDALRKKMTGDVAAIEKAGAAGFTNLGQIVGNSIANIGTAVTSLGVSLTAALTLPIAAIATLGVRFNATKEQILVAFGVLLKSGEKAKELYADLQKFAADTPFELPEIAASTKSLLAFGVAQDKILPTLKQLGDLASGVGIPLNELAQIYGKAKTQGTLFAEDINQLTGRGIPIIQELAKQFGVAESEVKKLVEQGKVGFPALEKAFANLTESGGQFAGMMEAQSKTFTGRLSTLADSLNILFGNLFEPLFNALSAAMPAIISAVEQISNVFTALGPAGQTVITIFLGIAAALGPVLLIVGSLLTAIGSMVSTLAGLTAAGTVMAGLAAVASAAGVALLAVTGFLLQMAPVIAVVAAQIAALYAAWQTNFGGIRDFTISAFNTVKSVVSEALNFIYGIVQTVGGALVGWWQANYPLIQQTVETVSNAVRNVIQGFLDTVRSLWEAHGQVITNQVSHAWDQIKTIVGVVVTQIGNIIRIAMQVINGDWQGAWKTIVSAVETGVEALTRVVVRLVTYLATQWSAIITTAVTFGIKFASTLAEWTTKAVIGVAAIVATLPLRLIALIPKLIAAGREIGAAIVRGIIAAFKEEAGTLSALAGGLAEGLGGKIGGSANVSAGPKIGRGGKAGGGGGGSGANDAAQRAAAELQAQIELQKLALQSLEDKYKETRERAHEEFKKMGDDVALVNALNAANKELAAGLRDLLPQIERLERAQLKDPTESQRKLLEEQQKQRQIDFKKLGDKDVAADQATLEAYDKKLADATKKIFDDLATYRKNNSKEISDILIANTYKELDAVVKSNLEILKSSKATKAQRIAAQAEIDAAIQRGAGILGQEYARLYEDDLAGLSEWKTAKTKEIGETIKDEEKRKVALEEVNQEYERRLALLNQINTANQNKTAEATAVPVTPEPEQPVGGFLGGVFSGLGTSVEEALAPVDKMNTLGQMIGATFSQVAQAVGQAVRSFVLFGSAGGSFRKFAAEVIASVAQMAIVQAVFELAQGFAMLALTWFTGNPKYAKSATDHFIAAAVFGMVGGVSAIAGRGIAGGAFKQESGGGFGTSGGGGQIQTSGQGQGQVGRGGEIFSSQKDQIREGSRNDPGGAGVSPLEGIITLKIESNDSHIVEVVKDNYQRAGVLRTVIKDDQ